MSAAEAYSLAGYLCLTGALLVLLVVVGLVRSHKTAMLTTVVGLLATGAALLMTLDAPALTVLHLLRLDGFAAFFNILFVIAALVTTLLGYRYLEGRRGELEEFYLLVLLATLGAMVMAAAIHFATFMLGLEILSISLYAMIAYPEEKHPPLEAALKYLVLSAVASTTVLFGMALIYNATGTMFFHDTALPADDKLVMHLRVGQALLFTGIAFKLSLVPFHMWTPDVYQGAPAPVTGYVATVSKGAVFALLFRLGVEGDALSGPVVFYSLSAFAVLSMVVGNLLALRQDNLKRLLAYSSIAHMGYLLVALIGVAYLADTRFTITTTMIYLAAYVLMTLVAFGVVAMLSSSEAGDDAQTSAQYQGLLWRRPLPAICMIVAMLSLMGMPLTVGFIGKFYLIATGVQGALWVLLWALIIGSAISVYYYVRVIYVMTRNDTPAAYPHPQQTGLGLPVVVVLSLAVIAIGVYPSPLLEIIDRLIGDFGM
ncbi:MAG: NADH-quinone oxidoreductase subunit N [Pseudomonadales bacterium]